MTDWTLKWFEVPKTGVKKYEAVLQNRFGEVKRVGFGDRRYEQYKDRIGHWSHLDHGDEKRKQAYRKRHAGEDQVLFSPGYFAWNFLWT